MDRMTDRHTYIHLYYGCEPLTMPGMHPHQPPAQTEDAIMDLQVGMGGWGFHGYPCDYGEFATLTGQLTKHLGQDPVAVSGQE